METISKIFFQNYGVIQVVGSHFPVNTTLYTTYNLFGVSKVSVIKWAVCFHFHIFWI